MRIAVIGAAGFLGWHLRCKAFTLGIDCLPVSRTVMADADRLADLVRSVDAIAYCAGVNRGTDAEVTAGNIEPAHALAQAVRRSGRNVRIVYANSIRAGEKTAYGLAKQRTGAILAGAGPEADAFSDVLLPNLYGEHGRPHYNSYVATFCHEIMNGHRPTVTNDREIPLLHVHSAVDTLLQEMEQAGHRIVEPKAEPVSVSEVLRILEDFESVYRHGELPDITDPFCMNLFNTYRSHLFPSRFPIALLARTDARGTLVECVRSGASGGQAFISSTAPGAVRGEHVHLRKFERFVIVSGDAEIALRRLFTSEVIRFRVSGEHPVLIDIPTMWLHRLTNVGDQPVTAFFWTNELFSEENADTFPGSVEGREAR